MDPSPSTLTAAQASPKSKWIIITVFAVVSVLGILGSWVLNKGLKKRYPQVSQMDQPLPVYNTISGDLQASDREGKPVSFSSLKGKVIACSYLYTKCPHGCAQVFTVMRKLSELHGTNPEFHLASVAVVPDLDPPSFLDSFAASQGVEKDAGWTFMSGHGRQAGWDFMHEQLKLEQTKEIPQGERLSECDICDHDLRIVLIDRQSRVRGFYQVMVADEATRELNTEKLLKDVKRLLVSDDF